MNDFFYKIGNKEKYASHHQSGWEYREDLAQKMQDWNALQGLLRKLNLDPVTSTTPASTSFTSPTSAPFIINQQQQDMKMIGGVAEETPHVFEEDTPPLY